MQCGLSASESDIKMTNELSALFARQLEMGGLSQPPAAEIVTPPTPQSSSPVQPTAPPVGHSISQHYHHSSHRALPDKLLPQPTEVTGIQKWVTLSPEEMLRVHDIEPSSLFPSQLTLFRDASLEQKLRIIELWRISNKTPVNPSSPLGFDDRPIPTGEMVGVEGGGHEQDYTTSHKLGQAPATVSGPRDDDEMMDMDSTINYGHAEPYVISGYQSLSEPDPENSTSHMQQPPLAKESSVTPYSHSTDPVYKEQNSAHQLSEQQIAMENQYGAFQLRNMYLGCGVRTAHWLHDNEML